MRGSKPLAHKPPDSGTSCSGTFLLVTEQFCLGPDLQGSLPAFPLVRASLLPGARGKASGTELS